MAVEILLHMHIATTSWTRLEAYQLNTAPSNEFGVREREPGCRPRLSQAITLAAIRRLVNITRIVAQNA